MNAIWLALVVLSVLTAAWRGTMPAVTEALTEAAAGAVELAIGLVGMMALFLGLMRVVQQGGLLDTLVRWLRPLMERLFPDVPPHHPAMGAMVLNIASNMLGLGNAATPFGIKAMIELNRLNAVPGVATNAMALFLAINTSNVALFPTGVISLRAAAGSADPAGIWLPTLFATSVSTLVGITVAKLLQRVAPPQSTYDASPVDVDESLVTNLDLPAARASSSLGCLVSAGVALGLLAALAVHVSGEVQRGLPLDDVLRAVTASWLLPVLVVAMALYGFAKGVAVYETLVEGAKEGFQVALRIIPFLVAILVAVAIFRASGLLAMLIGAVAPLTDLIGLPGEALPMALLRPLSGSGAYGVMAEIMQTHGPDSRIGYIVSTLQGSTETTFYVLAVYFGAVGVTRVRHALLAGLLADVAGVLGAVAGVRIFVG